MTPYQTLIEQQSSEVFVCTVPFPDLTPVGDDLVIETDRLLSHCLSSLNATVAGIIRLLDVLGRMKLTDSHKSYALREAVRHLTKSVCNAHTLRSYFN
jgi:hypothetical protein